MNVEADRVRILVSGDCCVEVPIVSVLTAVGRGVTVTEGVVVVVSMDRDKTEDLVGVVFVLFS